MGKYYEETCEPQDKAGRLQELLKEKTTQLSLARKECKLLGEELERSEKRYRAIVENAAKALKESEKLYRAIVEDQTDLICRFLPDYNHTFVNKAYCDYFRRSPDELLGQSFMILVPEDYRRELDNKLHCLTMNNPVLTHEQHTFTREGEERWQQWSDRAIFDDSGRVIEFQAVGRDISELKKTEQALRKSEKLYRAIVEDQTELVCRFLPDGTHSFVNMPYCQYFHKSREELLGSSFLLLVPADYREELQKKLDALNPFQPVMVHEQRTFSPDGKDQWQQWSNRAIFDDSGRIIEFQSAGRDITKRKKMEDALKESENTLRKQKKSLEEKNTALKEVLEQIGIEKKVIKEQVIANVEELLIPIINKLRLESTTIEEKYLDLFSRTLEEIASSFGQQISRAGLKLTNREIEVCNMVKTGLSSKEIAELLHISLDTVGHHRNSIRKKLNLIKSKQNLSAFLRSLQVVK